VIFTASAVNRSSFLHSGRILKVVKAQKTRAFRTCPEELHCIKDCVLIEDVLIGKVRKLYETQAHADRIDTDHVIENRYEDIRHFETYLYHNSVRTVKIFLNVSREEQARRFLDRIEEPEKNWKFSESDWNERKYWDEYMSAFEDAINHTATKECPWYVVPADHKWYMRYVVSEIILSVLKDMDPHYPKVTADRLLQFAQLKQEIEAELPEKNR
jgi:hypothetical protein